MEIKVRHSPYLGGIGMLLGIAIGIFGFLQEDWLMTGVGVGNLVLGGLLLYAPKILIQEQSVQIKNIFGLNRQEIRINHPSELRVIDDLLYLERDGKRAPIQNAGKKLAHNADWEYMEKNLQKLYELEQRSKK